MGETGAYSDAQMPGLTNMSDNSSHEALEWHCGKPLEWRAPRHED